MEICWGKDKVHGVHRDRRTNLTGTIWLDTSERCGEQAQHQAGDMSGRRRAPGSPLQAFRELVERHILRAADLERRTAR